MREPQGRLACISHHPTAEARDTTATTSLRLLAVLDVRSSTPARAKRLAPSPDGPLAHFTSPRGEKCRLEKERSMRGTDVPQSLPARTGIEVDPESCCNLLQARRTQP
ncbi:MAG: hypothetical protein OXL36_20925 [Bryobacterales bacterium]|nr:hypothetical protein [Bryobacterales bacterium]